MRGYNTPYQGYRTSRGYGWLKWAVPTAVVLIIAYWFFIMYWANASSRIAQVIHLYFWEQLLFPNGWNLVLGSPLLYIVLACVAGVVAYKAAPGRTKVVALVAAPVLLVYSIVGLWVNIPAAGASFSQQTTIVVEDINNLPPTLSNLASSLEQSNDSACDRTAVNSGVPVCVKQGRVDLQWLNRNVSAAGATTVIGRNAASDNNADLLEQTIASIRKGDSSVWSGIIDGANQQPIKGVAEWSGQYGASTDICTFSGPFELNKAFQGRWGINLSDEIADKYPNYWFHDSDMWGYCKGNDAASAEPVIVIPMLKQAGYQYRTTLQFAGVLVIEGSPTGDAKFTLDTDVQQGEYPGPVYPATLAAEQRGAANWAAGLQMNWFRSFGYMPTTIDTNVENPSEYQLVSKLDGKNYWVTPLSPNGSNSQNIIAYAVVPADVAVVGKLNPLTVYVLNGDSHDARVANLQMMEQNVVSAINRTEPSFTTSGGSIKEFLPVSSELWQVYAERGGLVKYKVEVKTDGTVVSVKTLETDGNATPSSTSKVCNKLPGEMNNAELTDCAKALAEESAKRMK
jgi:hypothetical protein